jgi:hypothetical protein
MLDDEIIQRIESFPFRRAPSPPSAGTKATPSCMPKPVLRLQGFALLDEVTKWKSSTGPCGSNIGPPVGPFGRTVAPLDKALRIIASEPIFWVGYSIQRP